MYSLWSEIFQILSVIKSRAEDVPVNGMENINSFTSLSDAEEL